MANLTRDRIETSDAFFRALIEGVPEAIIVATPDSVPASAAYQSLRGATVTFWPPEYQCAANSSDTTAIAIDTKRASSSAIVAVPSPMPIAMAGTSTLMSGIDHVRGG